MRGNYTISNLSTMWKVFLCKWEMDGNKEYDSY